MTERVPVTFEPSAQTAWVEPGTLVVDAASRVGIEIPVPCGGRGVCGSCGVRVRAGVLAPPDAQERSGLRSAPSGVRLACRARIAGPVTLRPIISHERSAARPHGGEAVDVLAAVDLGTTTVAAALVRVDDGCELSRAVVRNAQSELGADVLTRISAALDGRGPQLRRAAEESVLAAIGAAAAGAGLSFAGVRRVAIAGNTAMASLLLGEDVEPLAGHPFEAPYGGCRVLSPDSLISVELPAADVVVLPPAAGFVGGDALGGAFAHGLLGDQVPTTLLVDVGTNAEIVLSHKGRLYIASAAAGPAFEGAGVECGGMAVPGAVERVEILAGGVRLSVIGGGEPTHFAGSGLLSALASLREIDLVSADGLLHEGERAGIVVERCEDGILRARFAPSAEECLSLSQVDLRSLQLAKAAIATGVGMVLARARVKPKRVERVLIAGAFGRAARTGDLRTLGLLPASLADKAEAVGNASLDGAMRVALEPGACGELDEAIERIVRVDLAADSAFQDELMRALVLAPVE